MDPYSNYSASQLSDALAGGLSALTSVFLCVALIALAVAAFSVWLFYRVFEKAGYNGWMGLLSLIPSFGWLVCLCILAFDTWPASKNAEGGSASLPVTPPTPAAPAPAPIVDPAPAFVDPAPVPVPEPAAPAPAPEPAVPAPEPAPTPAPSDEPTETI
jgi:hypothetical protein